MKSRQYGIPDGIGNGQKTVAVAGTAEQLASTVTEAICVTIKALSTNTGIVYVGISTVDSADGFELANPGDSVSLDLCDLSLIYLDVSVSGEGVSFIYTT